MRKIVAIQSTVAYRNRTRHPRLDHSKQTAKTLYYRHLYQQKRPERHDKPSTQRERVLGKFLKRKCYWSFHFYLDEILKFAVLDPIHFKIPVFMPSFSVRFWDSLFAKSHESSHPCSAGIPTFLRAHHLPKSRVLSAPMELRIHWIYPRECGIFDLTESRTLSERKCRNALKPQAFLQTLPQSFRPFWKQDKKYRKCGFPW